MVICASRHPKIYHLWMILNTDGKSETESSAVIVNMDPFVFSFETVLIPDNLKLHMVKATLTTILMIV